MNRFGAFTIHLGISFLVFIAIGYVIVFHWYPDFFFTADGGWQGIRIVAFVDLVLGPILTLVVFNKSKPREELKRDLTLIGTFQAVCLAAGVWVVFSERPLAMVYADGSFQTMTTDDYVESNQPVPSFVDIPGRAPYWVSVVLPDDLESRSAIRREQLINQRSLKTAGEYYLPFNPEHVNLEADGLTRFELERIGMQVFDQFVRERGGKIEDYVYLPFATRYEQALMAMRRKDGDLFYIQFSIEHLMDE